MVFLLLVLINRLVISTKRKLRVKSIENVNAKTLNGAVYFTNNGGQIFESDSYNSYVIRINNSDECLQKKLFKLNLTLKNLYFLIGSSSKGARRPGSE
jgi:hypothetical protein